MAVIAVTGLRAEARIARRAGLSIVCAGGVPARTAAALNAAIDNGVTGLVSFGMCGGLAPSFQPGTLVCARAVIAPDGTRYPVDEAWHARTPALAETVEGDVFGSNGIVGTRPRSTGEPAPSPSISKAPSLPRRRRARGCPSSSSGRSPIPRSAICRARPISRSRRMARQISAESSPRCCANQVSSSNSFGWRATQDWLCGRWPVPSPPPGRSFSRRASGPRHGASGAMATPLRFQEFLLYQRGHAAAVLPAEAERSVIPAEPCAGS